jgi:hypothetical protein
VALLKPTCCSVLLLAGTHLARAQSQAFDEYQVKAAFLYNFAKFVEWPSDSFKNPTDPISICVLGANPFGHRLEDAVKGKQINERRLLVRQISDVAEAAACHIVFVAAETKRPADLLGRVKASPVLTVGETANFAAAGGVMAFKLESGKVRLEISILASDRARLRISSKLLSLAEIVKEGKK